MFIDPSIPAAKLLWYPRPGVAVLSGWWTTILEEKQPRISIQQNILGNWCSCKLMTVHSVHNLISGTDKVGICDNEGIMLLILP